MKQVIEKLRNEKLTKYQNVALDILTEKFENLKVRYAPKDVGCGDYTEVNSPNYEEFLQICRSQFLIKREQVGDDLLTENWGGWLATRIYFNLTEKQFQLIRRNSSHDNETNINEELLNDNLQLFGDVYLQTKVGCYDLGGGKYQYQVVGHVYYTKNKKTEYPTIVH